MGIIAELGSFLAREQAAASPLPLSAARRHPAAAGRLRTHLAAHRHRQRNRRQLGAPDKQPRPEAGKRQIHRFNQGEPL